MSSNNDEVDFCRQLLAINPDNHAYHDSLRQVLGLLPTGSGELSERQQKELEALYEGLVQDFPKSTTPPRMQLDFLVRRCTLCSQKTASSQAKKSNQTLRWLTA